MTKAELKKELERLKRIKAANQEVSERTKDLDNALLLVQGLYNKLTPEITEQEALSLSREASEIKTQIRNKHEKQLKFVFNMAEVMSTDIDGKNSNLEKLNKVINMCDEVYRKAFNRVGEIRKNKR